jgi:hypothetical protein
MDPTPYFIMGSMAGCGATLLIQAYGRRKVRKALALSQPVSVPDEATAVTAEMRQRIAVLEQIITDQPRLLAREIETLR